MIIFPHTKIEEINALIDRVRHKLREFSLPELAHKVTFSTGVSNILSDDITVDDIIKRADSALYIPKLLEDACLRAITEFSIQGRLMKECRHLSI